LQSKGLLGLLLKGKTMLYRLKVERPYVNLRVLKQYIQEIAQLREAIQHLDRDHYLYHSMRERMHALRREIHNAGARRPVYLVSRQMPNRQWFQVRSTSLSDALADLRSELRYQRADRKNRWAVPKRYAQLNYSMLGGVFLGSGSILALLERKRRRDVKKTPSPTDRKRYIGLEVEFCTRLDESELIDLILEQKLEKIVGLHTDGSIEPETHECDGECNLDYSCECPEDNGFEIVMLTSEENHTRNIERLGKFLQAANAYVNHSCGLHVHLDARTRDTNVMVGNLLACQEYLYKMQPKSRQTNEYCQPLPNGRRDRRFYVHNSRYHGINCASYREHGTIEVRLHAGTTNTQKITDWVRWLIAIVDAPKITAIPRSLPQLWKAVPCFLYLREYVKNRIKRFKTPRKRRRRSVAERFAA
jgi:hypothetical protein